MWNKDIPSPRHKAEAQGYKTRRYILEVCRSPWIPAFAGMT